MPTNDMGDIDALGGVFADDRLDRLLLGEVQLVSVEKQEGLIVNGEHLLVALMGVEGYVVCGVLFLSFHATHLSDKCVWTCFQKAQVPCLLGVWRFHRVQCLPTP